MANDSAGKIISTPADPVQAKKKAKGTSKKAAMKGEEADLKIRGIPTLKAKTTVELEGLGSKFSGNWRIKSIKHEISNGVYSCSANAVRPNKAASPKGTPKTEETSGQSNAGGNSSTNADDDFITFNVR